ncbi:hypothetical protein Pcinc_010806 [Petrolisthes cinctipes]|uniref:Uncharacterized protein n=1 Tax=Petrolisthes cinctipes TaxID=88211 RepID=A0AAE1KV25_PETCI|nr:hypothetical protein Pcinc_010806 [Petrolisthes cinctipes]
MLSYKGNITRELVAKRTLLETARQIDKRRREIDTSTAIFSISYEKISKKHKQRKKMSTNMKLLRSSERIMEEQLNDLLESAEMYIDTAMKNGCSRCGTTTAVAPSFAAATTKHGADLPINLPPFSKRWVAIPPGRKQTPTDHSFGDERKRCEKRLIVEQIGRYDGSRFVPNFSGKLLFWTSKGTNLGHRQQRNHITHRATRHQHIYLVIIMVGGGQQANNVAGARRGQRHNNKDRRATRIVTAEDVVDATTASSSDGSNDDVAGSPTLSIDRLNSLRNNIMVTVIEKIDGEINTHPAYNCDVYFNHSRFCTECLNKVKEAIIKESMSDEDAVRAATSFLKELNLMVNDHVSLEMINRKGMEQCLAQDAFGGFPHEFARVVDRLD